MNEAQRPELKALRAETRAAYAHARTLEQQWPNVEHAMIEAHKVRASYSYAALYPAGPLHALAHGRQRGARGQ